MDEAPLSDRIKHIIDGEITITHKNITVSSTTKNVSSKRLTFERTFQREELDSIELATSLTSTESEFRKYYQLAQDLFNSMKILYYYGNPFHIFKKKFKQLDQADIENYKCFFNFTKHILSDLNLEGNRFFFIQNSQYFMPKLPRFLTVENIIFLSKLNDPAPYFEKLGYQSNIKTDPRLINFPYLKTIYMLLSNDSQENNLNKLGIQNIKEYGQNSRIIMAKFEDINNSFKMNNIHFIKVEKPAYCYHLLFIATNSFLNERFPILGQILYCHKNTNIREYLDEFTSEKQKSFTRCIIFHPEFLDESNRNILKEEAKTRISSVSIKSNKKILVITSIDFTSDKDFITNFDKDDITSCRLTSLENLVQPNLSDVCLESSTLSTSKVNEEVQFIDRENQHLHFRKEGRIRLKFAPEIFDTDIDFWDELFGTIFYTYYVTDSDIIIYANPKFSVTFEEPTPGLITDLNDFPFPMKNDNRNVEPVLFPVISIQNDDNLNQDPNEKSVKNFMNSITRDKQLGINPNDQLITVIQKVYKILFNEENFDKKVSVHLLHFISDYIERFSTDYIDCLWDANNLVRRCRFLLLIMSALYVYNLAPKGGFSIMCFSGSFDKNPSNKRIDFYTTKQLEEFKFIIKPKEFTKINDKSNFKMHYNEKVSEPIYNIFVKCLTSSSEVENQINDMLKKASENKSSDNNADSLIVNHTLSWPKFFKAVIIVSRMYLRQPTILSGDTGCGKTSFMRMFQQLISLIKDCKFKFYTNLNIHGDVGRKDIEDYLRESHKSDQEYCNAFFFDEFNTSDALPFIEHIFINGYTEDGNLKPYVFLGAINPLVKADEISKIFSKIGMEQNISTEKGTISLLNLNKSEENINNYKYFVHKLNESEDLIIDFNPMILNPNTESIYLPQEEKMLIHKIIEMKLRNFKDEDKETLFRCIEWIRRFMNENAVVSTRDVKSVFDFYNEYYDLIDKNDPDAVKKSFQLALISVFALRLPERIEIPSDNEKIMNHLFNLQIPEENGFINVRQTFLKQIGDPVELMNLFDYFTYWYLRDTIMVDDKIWKFKSFLYHIVIMKLTIHLTKACFVIGPPGTSKSFALEQIAKDPNTFVTTYMCSRGSSSEGLKSQFYDAIYIGFIKKKKSVISFEEMGLANINKRRPLKYIHFALDLGIEINTDHQYLKVASIGVSNYAMDLANMNRGTLIYTDIPNIVELKINFSQFITIKECSNKSFSQFRPIYDDFVNKLNNIKSNVHNEWIEKFFKALWPNNSQPKTLALRSIYSLYQITRDYFRVNKKKEITTTYFCRIAREIVNAKRLIKINENNQINDDFKDLAIPAFDFILRMFEGCIYELPDELIEKPSGSPIHGNYTFEINKENRTIKCYFESGATKIFKIKVDNLYILLDRIISKDSFKSLCLLTENYSALDNIQSILLDKLPKSISDLQFILDSKDTDEVIEKIKNMPDSENPDVSFYFEEDFKKTNSSSKTQKSINHFIRTYMTNPKEIPVIVGNNTMLDSLLDILNANKINSKNTDTFNALISSDGFSWSYDIRTDFYIVLILQLGELITKMGYIPLPLLDRLEIVYIDWSLLKYLVYFKMIQKSEQFVDDFRDSNLSYRQFIDMVDQDVCKYLNTQVLPDTKCPNRFVNSNVDEYLHSSLNILYKRFDKWNRTRNEKTQIQMIQNNYLNDYLKETRWEQGIQCVIYTKSMLFDKVYFENNFRVYNLKAQKETTFNYLIIDDESIANEDHFNQEIETNFNYNVPMVYIIKCSKYSEMHDQHIKKLIEKKKLNERKKKESERSLDPSFFIIYFHTGKEDIKSTMNWPAFWIEDISSNQLVLYSRNSADLEIIYSNLTNQDFKKQNKAIMVYLIDRLFEFLNIPEEEESKRIQDQFKKLIKKYYQDNCGNLIDSLEEFHENPNSQYSIQTQIFNHLMDQVKHKLLYFLNVLCCHFLAGLTSSNFLSKKVYEFLRINYNELPQVITNLGDNGMVEHDFKIILREYANDFLRNSPYLYFPNTFGYRLLDVIERNTPFEQFIDLFKRQEYRNEYFHKLKLESRPDLQMIFKHLNRKGFEINNKFKKIIFSLFEDREFKDCVKQLMFSRGITLDRIKEENQVVKSYIGYSDSIFNDELPHLIELFNTNSDKNIISYRFENIFIYFDYILNINIIELIPKEAYDDIESFCSFKYNDKYNLKYFWNRYILIYIISKKDHNPKKLNEYQNIVDDTEKSLFFKNKENYDLSNDRDLQEFFSYLYGPFFFTAPQIAYSNQLIFNQFERIFVNFVELIKGFENQRQKVDLAMLESLIRTSCLLELKQASTTPEQTVFQKFTKDITDSNYCEEMVRRIHGITFSQQNLKKSIPQYTWESVKNEISSSNLVVQLQSEFNNIYDAPSFNGHSFYEILHLYMTDIDSFNKIMGVYADMFVQWFFQDTKEDPLYIVQIYLLFRAVKSNTPDLIENQLIALLSLSLPWKVINHDNLNDYLNSSYNYFPSELIKLILAKPASFKRHDIINNNDVTAKLNELCVTTEGKGGYLIVDDNDIYTLDETLPTISSVIYNHFVFHIQSKFPVLQSFVRLQKHQLFLAFSSKMMKIIFKLRKLFANNSRALFVILNCFSFVRSNEYELIQDLPFISKKFDKLFNIKNNEDRNIFSLADFNNCANAYQQLDYVSKKYFELHNDFVSIQKEKIILPLYDFIPDMSITRFDFNKFLASSIFTNFISFSTGRQFLTPNNLEEILISKLTKNVLPFVTFDMNKRFEFDHQVKLDEPQNIDFLGMCKEDWLKIMSVVVNEPDSDFVQNLRTEFDQSKGCNMTRIASLLLQIYYRDQCDEYLEGIIPRPDFGDLITINLGFEIPRIIVNAPIFEYICDNLKNIIRHLLE